MRKIYPIINKLCSYFYLTRFFVDLTRATASPHNSLCGFIVILLSSINSPSPVTVKRIYSSLNLLRHLQHLLNKLQQVLCHYHLLTDIHHYDPLLTLFYFNSIYMFRNYFAFIIPSALKVAFLLYF